MKVRTSNSYPTHLIPVALLGCGLCVLSLPSAIAQSKPASSASGKAAAVAAKAGAQVTKPVIALAYMDLATNASDMPGGMMGAAQSSSFLGALGGMARGSSSNDRGNVFGNTHALGFANGKYVDVSVFSNKNTAMTDATQAIPAGMNLGDSLKLYAPAPDKPMAAVPAEESPTEPSYEKPKGKISIYWGCGETVRAGQPRTIDVAKASPEEYAKFFIMRGKFTKGARSLPGNPAWPNKQDDRKIPDNASLVGQHQFSGNGLPENFKFNLNTANDLMPPIELQQTKRNGSTSLEWKNIANARAYFISVMGGQATGSDSTEMVVWTSSEQADFGFGLLDYQSNGDIDKWLSEKILLPANTNKCDVPKGIFGDQGTGMLRMIAYGSDAYFVYPPRPAAPKLAWEPEWQTKLRVKSTFSSILGGFGDMSNRNSNARAEQQKPEQKEENKVKATDVLKGLLGF